jgi:hypothetical protein
MIWENQTHKKILVPNIWKVQFFFYWRSLVIVSQKLITFRAIEFLWKYDNRKYVKV